MHTGDAARQSEGPELTGPPLLLLGLLLGWRGAGLPLGWGATVGGSAAVGLVA